MPAKDQLGNPLPKAIFVWNQPNGQLAWHKNASECPDDAAASLFTQADFLGFQKLREALLLYIGAASADEFDRAREAALSALRATEPDSTDQQRMRL